MSVSRWNTMGLGLTAARHCVRPQVSSVGADRIKRAQPALIVKPTTSW